MSTPIDAGPVADQAARRSLSLRLQHVFVRVGVLPFLLVITIVTFTLMSTNFSTDAGVIEAIWNNKFTTWRNIENIARQSSYLTMIAMGQMLALLTGGFD